MCFSILIVITTHIRSVTGLYHREYLNFDLLQVFYRVNNGFNPVRQIHLPWSQNLPPFHDRETSFFYQALSFVELYYTQMLFFIFLICPLCLLILWIRQKKRILKKARLTNYRLQRQNQRLELQEQKLQEINRMKDHIFSVLGHDLRTPLSSVLMMIEILEHEAANQEEAKHLNHMKNDVQLTLNTLENILSWSRLQMKDGQKIKQKIDIPTLFAEMEIVYSKLAQQKGVTLHFSYPETSLLEANPHQIRSVVTNLITNAIKFSKEGGTIQVSYHYNDHFQEISVTDTGIGISPKMLQHLEEKIFRHSTPGTNGEKGTGIGLSLVKEFVENNQGKLIFQLNSPIGTKAIARFYRLTPITSEKNMTA